MLLFMLGEVGIMANEFRKLVHVRLETIEFDPKGEVIMTYDAPLSLRVDLNRHNIELLKDNGLWEYVDSIVRYDLFCEVFFAQNEKTLMEDAI